MDTNANVCEVVDYLDDGYTAKATLPAQEGVHNALSLEFRPCLSAEQSRVFDVLDKKGSEAANAATVEIVAKHIVSWSKTDRRGSPVPASKDAVAKLVPPLLTKVIDAVLYGKLPDGVKLDVEADLKN